MNILLIDFETSGLDATKDEITEVGAVLATWNHLTGFQVVGTLDQFVHESWYKPLPQVVIDKTGITDGMLLEFGRPFTEVVTRLGYVLQQFSGKVDMIIAHNKAFDEGFFRAAMQRFEDVINSDLYAKLWAVPWVCSIQDMPHATDKKCKKLSHLALDYGLTVNPRVLHRALDDVKLLMEMLSAAKFDMAKILERSYKPDVVISAVIPLPWKDGGKGKDAARAAGFGWQQAPGRPDKVFDKLWVKITKEDEIDSEKEKLGYEVKRISN